MNSIKLISVNIEGDKHVDRVQNFLKNENPDAVCLQEVFEKDVTLLKSTLFPHHIFVPMMKVSRDGKLFLKGLAFLSRLPIVDSFHEYYAGKNYLPISTARPNSNNRVLLVTTIMKGNEQFTIASTHFIWSSKGKTTNKQKISLENLLKILQKIGDCILCGDFNAPRGRLIYKRLASLYTDNIPKEVTSTLDPILHEVKGLEFVVDYLFSTPKYSVTNVKVAEGVSDHKAIVAQIKTHY